MRSHRSSGSSSGTGRRLSYGFGACLLVATTLFAPSPSDTQDCPEVTCQELGCPAPCMPTTTTPAAPEVVAPVAASVRAMPRAAG